MSSVVYDTFVIERTFDATPERVFQACSNPVTKARWFNGSADTLGVSYHLDFRVGGHESNRGGPQGGPVYTFEADIHDIVPDERIVTTYEMTCDGRRISVSVATVELHAEGDKTRFVWTEQGVFLDDLDNPEQRAAGTSSLLDSLGAELESSAVV
jgi:uncharacterized protein YndB with AHSA1/START domain